MGKGSDRSGIFYDVNANKPPEELARDGAMVSICRHPGLAAMMNIFVPSEIFIA